MPRHKASSCPLHNYYLVKNRQILSCKKSHEFFSCILPCKWFGNPFDFCNINSIVTVNSIQNISSAQVAFILDFCCSVCWQCTTMLWRSKSVLWRVQGQSYATKDWEKLATFLFFAIRKMFIYSKRMFIMAFLETWEWQEINTESVIKIRFSRGQVWSQCQRRMPSSH